MNDQMTDLTSRKPFKISPSQKFPWFKKLCTKKKMTDLMTDFIKGRKSLEKRYSEKLQQFKKVYTKNLPDTNLCRYQPLYIFDLLFTGQTKTIEPLLATKRTLSDCIFLQANIPENDEFLRLLFI